MILAPTHTCFDDALDYLEWLAFNQQWGRLLECTLVHGVCLTPDGRPYVHAWVEFPDNCVGAGIVAGERVWYYVRRRDWLKEFRPQLTTRYTLKEAYENNKRTNHYGPWESYYRDMILNDGKEETWDATHLGMNTSR